MLTRCGACAATGETAKEVLQAAHIVPFADGHVGRNDPDNGLLLRADIHLLFDSLRMSIDPRRSVTRLAPPLRDGSCRDLHERALAHQADQSCLDSHFQAFRSRWRG